jgi:hypothetical protein
MGASAQVRSVVVFVGVLLVLLLLVGSGTAAFANETAAGDDVGAANSIKLVFGLLVAAFGVLAVIFGRRRERSRTQG